MKTFIAALGGLMLVGCASRSPLPEKEYHNTAKTWVALGYCSQEGHIPVELAARGFNWLQTASNTFHTVDVERMRQLIEQNKGMTLTSAECRSMGAAVHTEVLRFEQQTKTAMAQPNQQVTITKPIFCNTIGTMTMCN